jgi:hypothetical protein
MFGNGGVISLKKIDKLVWRIEKYGLTILFLILTFLLFILPYMISIETLIDKTTEYFLISKNEIFITISAIFIGAYFAILGFLASLKPMSIVSKLSKENLSKIFKYLFTALLWSFIYLILTLLLYDYNDVNDYKFFDLIVLLSLIMMLISAIRFGFYSYFIIKHDIERIHDEINNQLGYEVRIEQIFNKLEAFLNEQEKEKAKLRNEQLKNHFKNKSN